MTSAELINKIENTYSDGITLHPAPRVPDVLTGLVVFKKNHPKYALDKDGQLIGLNLAKTGLLDTQWDKITALLEQNSIHLQALNLSDNQLSDLKLPTGIKALKKLDVSGNKLDKLPNVVVGQGSQAILEYLQQTDDQGGKTTPLYEAKLLIVGQPGAGKTTLLKKLKDPTYIVDPAGDETVKSTVGINIFEDFEFPYVGKKEVDVSFKANVWDFGGQEIQYMTHHFFLTSRALYVLVADDRKQDTHFDYWFRIINLLGRESEEEKVSVLVVLNEIKHESVTNFDKNKYVTDYPGINIEVCEVDFSKDDHRSQNIVPQIQRMLCDLPHIGDEFPVLWKPIRKDLFDARKQQDHIDFNTFAAICAQERNGLQLDKRKEQEFLSKILHQLGVMLHYQEDDDLYDFIILRPQWVMDAVYSVMKDKRVVDNNGRFTKEDLRDFWKKYAPEERSRLRQMMLKDKFEICYQVPHSDVFIAPQLLPSIQPAVEWDSSQTLKFCFQYPFMPMGLISRLIVRLSEDIAGKGDWVWKYGVYIKRSGCLVKIIQEKGVKSGLEVLSIEISGKEEKRIHILDYIIKEVERIHKKSFKHIPFFKMVACNCRECKGNIDPHFFDYNELLERQETSGFEQVVCPVNGLKKVYVKAVLSGVSDRFKSKSVDISQIKEWISEDKMKKVIDEIMASYHDNNDLILLVSSWNTLENAVKQGYIVPANEIAEKTKIKKHFLATLDEILRV